MRIGELARQAGVSVDTVRFYEQRGLLPRPARTASGYREFSPDDAKRLCFICHAKELGFTLGEIKQLLALRSGGSDCVRVRQVAEAKADEIRDRIDKLAAMRAVLLELARQCEQGTDGDICPILNSLEQGND
ncbi:MAG: heavy metal-responsive transcriptional regulator [Mariprofundaceae bacterium]